MRVPTLPICCAALSLAALPAAALAHSCPGARASHHVVHRGAFHDTRAAAVRPVARPAPVHYEYQRVHAPNGMVATAQPAPDRWRQDRRAWADNNWSGRVGPGCHDANGPGAYRDGDGDHRAAPDRGMRCHDGGMRRERAYAQSSGQFNYTREVDSGWSSSERSVRIVRNDGWGGDGRRPSMTDRYGFLTWPGKTHFLHGQPVGPMGDAPDIGPQAPPEESWQVHP